MVDMILGEYFSVVSLAETNIFLFSHIVKFNLIYSDSEVQLCHINETMFPSTHAKPSHLIFSYKGCSFSQYFYLPKFPTSLAIMVAY